jgi:hypothetical protein
MRTYCSCTLELRGRTIRAAAQDSCIVYLLPAPDGREDASGPVPPRSTLMARARALSLQL